VKGTLVFGKASPFAGRRRNEDLGRSAFVGSGSLPLPMGAPMTAGVRRTPREGNDVGVRSQCVRTRLEGFALSLEDASLTRLSDPRTSIVTSLPG